MLELFNGAFVRAYLRLRREEGQTFVEYALIGVLVAIALVTGITTFKGEIASALTNIGNQLTP